jgi:hypothetical protein
MFEILEPLFRWFWFWEILLLTFETALRLLPTLTFPELILLLILSIDCCLVLAGTARFTVVRVRLF